MNQFILIEVDEGDNDEEVVIERIFHVFTFEATDRGGLITWDFGDGFTATGSDTTHTFETPRNSYSRSNRIHRWKSNDTNDDSYRSLGI